MRLRLLDRDSLQEIGQSIRRNRRRSIATAFGVFWGLFMLVILLSISRGFENGIARELLGVSPRAIAAWSGSTSKPYKGFKAGRYIGFRVEDAEQLAERIPEIQAVAYHNYSRQRRNKSATFGIKRSNATVVGINAGFFDVHRVQLIHGRLMSQADIQEERKVCILGNETAEELFGKDLSQGIGKSIQLNNRYYTVIGIVRPVSQMINIGTWVPESAYIPFGLMNKAEGLRGRINSIAVDLYPSVHPRDVQGRIKAFLQERHHIAPEDNEALEIFMVEEMLALFESILLGINILVWIVGIGTLLTAVVGVSNIMLVTVRERTQEIGVRRAIGAKPLDIIVQILSESVFLTFISGLIGIILGVALMSLIVEASGLNDSASSRGDGLPFYNPTINPAILLISLLIVILGGLLAGALPASRALDIKAIDAIREE